MRGQKALPEALAARSGGEALKHKAPRCEGTESELFSLVPRHGLYGAMHSSTLTGGVGYGSFGREFESRLAGNCQ
jgi:hypothetical protein